MKILKLWYFFCLVFAFNSLNNLVEESYEVAFEKRNETEPVQYSACEELSDIHPNKKETDLPRRITDTTEINFIETSNKKKQNCLFHD